MVLINTHYVIGLKEVTTYVRGTPGRCFCVFSQYQAVFQHTRHMEPILARWWASVEDGGPALN